MPEAYAVMHSSGIAVRYISSCDIPTLQANLAKQSPGKTFSIILLWLHEARSAMSTTARTRNDLSINDIAELEGADRCQERESKQSIGLAARH